MDETMFVDSRFVVVAYNPRTQRDSSRVVQLNELSRELQYHRNHGNQVSYLPYEEARFGFNL